MVRKKVNCERCGKEFTTKTTKIKDDKGKSLHVPRDYLCGSCKVIARTGRPLRRESGHVLTDANRLKEMQILSRRVNIANRLQMQARRNEETKEHIEMLGPDHRCSPEEEKE